MQDGTPNRSRRAASRELELAPVATPPGPIAGRAGSRLPTSPTSSSSTGGAAAFYLDIVGTLSQLATYRQHVWEGRSGAAWRGGRHPATQGERLHRKRVESLAGLAGHRQRLQRRLGARAGDDYRQCRRRVHGDADGGDVAHISEFRIPGTPGRTLDSRTDAGPWTPDSGLASSFQKLRCSVRAMISSCSGRVRSQK